MASIDSFRRNWLRAHSRYEREALRVLLGVFKDWGESIQWDVMDEFNYSAVVELNVDIDLMFDAYLQIYTSVGIDHGRNIGASINTQLKNFTDETFLNVFTRDVLQWIRLNVAQNIFSVAKTYKAFVNTQILEGLAEGESIEEITSRLQKIITRRNFYRWQAQRIARTETATAANYGATVASNVSGFVMQKVWISVIDARTRRPPKSHFNHVAMNGKRVGQNELFNVNGDEIRFPVDPNGQPENIINCRCGLAIAPARDSDGNLIATS